MEDELHRNTAELLKVGFMRKAREQKASYELEVLSDILVIEKLTDSIEKLYGLTSVIDRLKSIGISEEDAILKIRAFTTNTDILACINENPETSIS